MSRKSLVFLIAGTFFTFLSVADVIIELFGVSAFLFGKKVFPVLLGVFIIIAVLSFTAFIFAFIKEKKGVLGKKTVIAAKTVSAVIAVTLVLASLFVIAIVNDRTVCRDISDDGRHEVIVEADTLFGGWSVSLYKRYTPFFKTEITQFYASDMADENEEVKVVWHSDSCDISYESYSDYLGTSLETSTQRLYFDDRTGQ